MSRAGSGWPSRSGRSPGTRGLGKSDMLHNDVCPEIRVDAQTFDVYVDGELAWCEPLERVALGQRYMLR